MSRGRGVCIEIFACSGGLAAGFREAGIEFDLAFDHDADACDSYEHNIGRRPIRMDVDDLLRMARAGWRPGPVDLVVADPPCTPWSIAGNRRGLADERDALRETVEIIRLLHPRAYLIGNIPGLQASTSLGVVRDTIGSLARDGYCVADFAELDAADFGVPQHRVRPFWYGHCGGGHILWPAPTHTDPALLRRQPSLPGMAALAPWVSCRDALASLPLSELGRPVSIGAKPNAPGRSKPAQGQRLGAPDEPASSLTSKSARIGAGEAHVLAWPWDRPSTVVCAETDKIGAAGRSGSHGEPYGANAIVLSERAAAILQGFPEGWRFAGKTKKSRWSQIGQAVPPPIARAIGMSIARALWG